MTRSIPLLVAVLVVVSSSYCDAQQSCLDIAHSKLAVGSKIKIYPVNGERFSGTLESIDLQTGFLNVILAESDNGRQEGQGSSGSEPSVMSVEVTEISKITYRKMGTPQAGWILGGTLAGGLIGVLAGVNFDTDNPDSKTETTLAFGAIGAAIGLAAGTAVSLLVPGTRTIKCEQSNEVQGECGAVDELF